MSNDTFLIKSSENDSIGTGFVVYKNNNLSYLVTCAHVVDACGEDSLLVEEKEASLVAIGTDDNIDLAVILVEDLDSVALKLSTISVYETMPFGLKGFKEYINEGYKFEKLHGLIKKSSQIKTKNGATIDIHELSLASGDSIEPGYSGSAIYSQRSRYVFAVAINRSNTTHADAISIKYLKDIWKDMPSDLLIESSILDEESLDKEYFVRLVNGIFKDTIEVFQRIVYSVLPKSYNTILPNTINEIVDVVMESKDINRGNIPILCLANILNTKLQDDVLSEWIERKKNRELLETEELRCIPNELDDFYNILIEVIVNNESINNSTILVWEDKVFKKGVNSYQNVILEEGINLEDVTEIALFLDKLILFLNKFSNPNNLLLEFILPKVLLKEEISLWKTSSGDTLSSKYRLIYRFHERVENYASYHKSWIANWKETYEDNNKLKKLGDIGLKLDTVEEQERINRTTKAIITAFPIADTDIFHKIYEHGTSILIAPASTLNQEELILFNTWFLEEFKDTKVEDMVVKINDFCVNNVNDFKSRMTFIWDNPNRIPAKYKNIREPLTPKGFEGFGF